MYSRYFWVEPQDQIKNELKFSSVFLRHLISVKTLDLATLIPI